MPSYGHHDNVDLGKDVAASVNDMVNFSLVRYQQHWCLLVNAQFAASLVDIGGALLIANIIVIFWEKIRWRLLVYSRGSGKMIHEKKQNKNLVTLSFMASLSIHYSFMQESRIAFR